MRAGEAPAVQELPFSEVGDVNLEIEERLLGDAFRKIVGGWLEALPLREALPPGTIVYCDEEGKLKGLPESFHIPGDVVCGTVIATGLDEDGGTRSLTEDEAAAICRLLKTLRLVLAFEDIGGES